MSNHFSRINFHSETVNRFKKYAIENERNYTETLEAMLDFFEKNYISPFETFNNSFYRRKNLLNKRMDAVEKILREQEVKYHKPLHKLLKSIFDEAALKNRKPSLIEERKNKLLIEKKIKTSESAILRNKYRTLEEERKVERENVQQLLNALKPVKPRFGKPYFKIDMDESELEILKKKLEA